MTRARARLLLTGNAVKAHIAAILAKLGRLTSCTS